MNISGFFNKSQSIVNTSKKSIALITGASSGIGYSFSCLLACKGYDIIAIARDTQRLIELKEELSNKYKSNVYILTLNLTNLNSINLIEKFLNTEGLNVDILINNAGFGIHGSFSETDVNKEIEMVNLQVNFTLLLTKIVLPYMRAKKSGYILNIGSVYSFSPVPYQSVYGACKAFLLSFTKSLAHENKKYGIKVTILCPGITTTEFRLRSNIKKFNSLNKNNIKKKKFFEMNPNDVAEQGYNALMRGDLVFVPGLTNRIFVQIATHLPTSLFSSTLTLINNFRGVNSKRS